jgi:drug/metabolite transporter (DMT)-like permease
VKPIVVESGSNAAHQQFRVKMNKEKKSSMLWVMFAVGAALSWGVYGAMLHQGQVKLGSPLRALLCVGVAYFLIGVIVPVAMLYSQGQLNGQGWNSFGATTATVAGALGAVGAVCIILAFKSGGLPTYVMPLVFGGAPVINVLVTMVNHPPKNAPNPLLFVGFLLVVLGASMVLYFRPQS